MRWWSNPRFHCAAWSRSSAPTFRKRKSRRSAIKCGRVPYEYVAQEQVALSTAPVWDHGRLYSRSLVLRTYVLNTGSGWIAMPGGLVRVAGADGEVVSMQRGGRSKDAWVLWDGRSTRSACCVRGTSRSNCSMRAATCPAAPPTIFSGWAVMRSGRNASRACCAA
jgi:hypothetical protein